MCSCNSRSNSETYQKWEIAMNRFSICIISENHNFEKIWTHTSYYTCKFAGLETLGIALKKQCHFTTFYLLEPFPYDEVLIPSPEFVPSERYCTVPPEIQIFHTDREHLPPQEIEICRLIYTIFLCNWPYFPESPLDLVTGLSYYSCIVLMLDSNGTIWNVAFSGLFSIFHLQRICHTDIS